MPSGIPKPSHLAPHVFADHNEQTFRQTALALFRFQYEHNPVYRAYCNALGLATETVDAVEKIPFLPITFFKTHNVQCSANSINEVVFESSGTTGQQPSRHLVADVHVYETSFRQAFAQFYGQVENYCILGLLPSYLERSRSSLVYMVADLIKRSGHPLSGFYLYEFDKLADTLTQLEAKGQKTILFGVTYALLDFAEQHSMPLQHTTIIETGGMKGRQQELLREEVHGLLKKSFSVNSIHSEYGMTELLSQAYATASGRFHTPPWMQVLIREEDDPFSIVRTGRTGGINIVDLANSYSCAFIATEDVGRLNDDKSFDVLGRLDNAEIRGCSLLAL